eukprot:c38176_g1_i1.p1 GENE.c38176_g1_i1~~c38176_g1_i1.p1  ORF type:complete len:163 (-),score=48.71 c38176_g1_i1:20-508(-)
MDNNEENVDETFLSTTKSFGTVVERYYTQYLNKISNQYVYSHVNGLCVVGVTKTHPLFLEGEISFVSFDINGNDRRNSKVRGKRKKGGLFVEKNTVICIIVVKTSSGEEKEFPITAGIRGHLIEINEKLSQNPSLIHLSECGKGYIAVIKPQKDNFEDFEKK